ASECEWKSESQLASCTVGWREIVTWMARACDTGRRLCQPTLVKRIGSCRFLPIDRYPRVVHLAQQPIGNAIVLALFALLLPMNLSWAVPITIAAGACAFAGSYRTWVLTLSTLTMTLYRVQWVGWHGLAAFCFFSLLAMYLVQRFRESLVGRHPVVCLLALFAIIVILACSGVLRGTAEAWLWTFIVIFAGYFWFLCYALVDQ